LSFVPLPFYLGGNQLAAVFTSIDEKPQQAPFTPCCYHKKRLTKYHN